MDDVMPGILATLRKVSSGDPPFDSLDQGLRDRAANAVAQGDRAPVAFESWNTIARNGLDRAISDDLSNLMVPCVGNVDVAIRSNNRRVGRIQKCARSWRAI